MRSPPHLHRSPGSNPPGEHALAATSTTALGGGVSSDIWIEHAPQGDYVVKRALGKLKVQADWFSDPARSSNEVNALRAIAELLGQAHVPKVLWVDDARHQFAMERIDPRFKNWKETLLSGHVDFTSARSVGQLLGRMHARSFDNAQLAETFANTQPLIELRIRPYFERIAERNPTLAPAVAEVVERLLATRIALVHGDFSPKNLLVDARDVVILDGEVAHWGDARFDVAFCLTHLLLKSFRRGAPMPLLLGATLAFLSAYRSAGLDVLDRDFVRQTGCLLLARLEGDSPIDYLDDLDTNAVARFATELILRPPACGEDALNTLSGSHA
jgi:5-methylthioribose kinase